MGGGGTVTTSSWSVEKFTRIAPEDTISGRREEGNPGSTFLRRVFFNKGSPK